MIIDAHIHMFSPAQIPERGKERDLGHLDTYTRLLFTPTKFNHTRQGWVSCERMIEIMAQEGVDKVTVLGATGQEDDYTAACLNKYPEHLIGFRFIHMARLRANLRDELASMRRAVLEEGFVGFGEHHPDKANHELYNKEFLAVMELAQELDVPINIHVSEQTGHFYYGKSHNPLEEYFWLAKRYPDLKLILAHWGGGLPFYEAIPAVRKVLKNVYYDTAASRLFFDLIKSTEQITKMVDPRKIFYGSDYPLLLQPDQFPDEWDPRFIPDRCDFLQANIAPEIIDGIMGENFADLLASSGNGNKRGNPGKSHTVASGQMSLATINGEAPIMELVNHYPATAAILKAYNIPFLDHRVPPWLGLVQPVAQRRIWWQDGFVAELRARLPATDELQTLDDLDLVHEKIRVLARKYPAARQLFEKYNLPCVDSPLPPWEPIEQAAATRQIWPILNLLLELQHATEPTSSYGN
jgi:predicted TIM-barrel fold metal-dependent hydrolase